MTSTPTAPSSAQAEAVPAPARLPVRTVRTLRGPGTQAVSLVLEPDDTAPGRARAALRAALTRWGLDGLTDDAEAVTSEIVANAANASTEAAPEGAGPASIIVHITAGQDTLTIRAWDPDPAPPPLAHQAPGQWDERGRGLIIVAALSDQWGWAPGPNGGKYVHATIPASPPGDVDQQGTPATGAMAGAAPGSERRAGPAQLERHSEEGIST